MRRRWLAATRRRSARSTATIDVLPRNGALNRLANSGVACRRLQNQTFSGKTIEPLLRAWSSAPHIQGPDLIVHHIAVSLMEVEGAEVVGICPERLPRFFAGRFRAGVRLSIRLNQMHHHEAGGHIDDVAGLTFVRRHQLTLLVAPLI